MNANALHTFVCPLSHAPLSLRAIEEHDIELTPADVQRAARLGIEPGELSKAIKTGVLYCELSRKWYPIINYVPLFLDYGTEIHRDFAASHSSAADLFADYDVPDQPPRPGEETVRKSFTKEWNVLDLDNTSFGLTPDQRDFFVRLELDWPQSITARDNLVVLEIGCGSGFESLSLDRVTGGLVFGIDLNLTLLRNGAALAANPFVNVASASLFAAPVRESSFDIVYSSGVLHHTHSTKAAFDQIIKYRKDNGLIYIWVYAKEDMDRSLYTRLDWIREDIFRPRLAKMSDVWQNLIVKYMARRHLKIYRASGGYSRELWTLENSEHFIRDRWTALFAHRHSFNEVITWFLENGLEYRLIDPKAYYEHFNVPLIGIGIRGAPAAIARRDAGAPEAVPIGAGR
ncbi:MAG TPA: class I SAM-dependent methyltransferase [Stellaceae bacterium]|jgi:SAM-dependent methyltransferase|nr:class I SAM-dependent methyltransferase [Stellaceae bacterium]